ncbi:MAG: bifunctional diaminohydroxyphosphoribosylaminopyrimidine deaminase/5-amino-6-(5-phosphoribosylamino)uracil reductase RibD [Wenzhouxiangellaceae bacterium]
MPSATPFSATDHALMAEALRWARKGLYSTAPNPRVGCIIARDGQVLGRGFHERAGSAHAEVVALAEAGSQATGATAYVTLEPCAHQGRTPPCADALIQAGLRRVVVAAEDPDPRVNGQGIRRLREAGIPCDVGLMRQSAIDLNCGFYSRIQRGRPWLRVKLAVSLDGRTAAADGSSQWITSDAARSDGHRWRARADVIITGIGTVLADDPRLDVRLPEAGAPFNPTPAVVVMDSGARLPANARLLRTGARVLQVVAPGAPPSPAGVERLELPAGTDGRPDPAALLAWLGRNGFNEAHLEAGPTLAGTVLGRALADELLLYQATTLLGDRGRAMVAIPALERLDQRLHFTLLEQRRIGTDWRLLLRATPTRNEDR